MSNTRNYNVRRGVINGVSIGGLTTVSYEEGYDNTIEASGEGQTFPTKDRRGQYCRGSIGCQDYTKMLEILTATLDDFVVYERISGAATFLKHTFTNPVVSAVSLKISNNQYSGITTKFECRASTATDTVSAMHATESAQTLPSATTTEYGGYQISSVVLGSLSISHATAVTLDLSATVIKSFGDDDLAYTAVDRIDDAIAASGSLSFEAGFVTNSMISQQLLLAAVGNLVITVKKAGGATNKVITIKNVMFSGNSANAAQKAYTNNSAKFTIAGNESLTLTGATAAIIIADAAEQ